MQQQPRLQGRAIEGRGAIMEIGRRVRDVAADHEAEDRPARIRATFHQPGEPPVFVKLGTRDRDRHDVFVSELSVITGPELDAGLAGKCFVHTGARPEFLPVNRHRPDMAPTRAVALEDAASSPVDEVGEEAMLPHEAEIDREAGHRRSHGWLSRSQARAARAQAATMTARAIRSYITRPPSSSCARHAGR